MNLIQVEAFTSLLYRDVAHDRQTTDMTKLWDSGELVSTCSGSSYFISEEAQGMHSPLLSWKGIWSCYRIIETALKAVLKSKKITSTTCRQSGSSVGPS